MIVLDASALIAFLLGEPGAADVALRLDECAMSTVNLAEVLSKADERGGDAEAVLHQIARTPIDIVPLTVTTALSAARLRSRTKPARLSMGDRVCLALAAERGSEAWTTDKRWAQASLNVRVRVLR